MGSAGVVAGATTGDGGVAGFIPKNVFCPTFLCPGILVI